MHLIVKSDRRIERAGYDSHYRCSLLAERNFRQTPMYDVCCEAPSPVVTLVGHRAHNGCSYGRTILHDMKPTCPTCNHRMSPATHVHLRRLPGACPVFRCPACRSFIAVVGKVRGATYQTSNQRMDSVPGPTKANPRRLSRQGLVTRWMTNGEP